MSRPKPASDLFEALTSGERECLEKVLDHRTAKEIALDKGITHHAVEKRLRRAREKLGAQSSVEAARWYAEDYGLTAYGSSGLEQHLKVPEVSPTPPAKVDRQWRFPAMMIMSLTLSLMLAGPNATDTKSETDIATVLENTLQQEIAIANANFERLDADGSGFIEKSEFVSPFSEYFLSLDESKPNTQGVRAGEIRFEADEVHIRYVDEAEEEAVIRLKDKRTTERREGKFGLIDRDENGRIDQSEFRLSYLEGLGPKTFTVHFDETDG